MWVYVKKTVTHIGRNGQYGQWSGRQELWEAAFQLAQWIQDTAESEPEEDEDRAVMRAVGGGEGFGAGGFWVSLEVTAFPWTAISPPWQTPSLAGGKDGRGRQRCREMLEGTCPWLADSIFPLQHLIRAAIMVRASILGLLGGQLPPAAS